jgi:hypothetical protein
VTPYGITTLTWGLPPVSNFSIASGSSEWEVVYNYARYYCGVPLRFDRLGRMLAENDCEQSTVRITDSTPVVRVIYREKRYGVLSEMTVMDKTSGAVATVTDASFQSQGGSCRRVLNMPGKSTFQVMRYNGEFQLRKSKQDYIRMEVEIPVGFVGYPGDLVTVQRSGWGCNGTYRVLEMDCGMDEDGIYTKLVLGAPDTVI